MIKKIHIKKTKGKKEQELDKKHALKIGKDVKYYCQSRKKKEVK
jgi:hypothetical protein